MKSQMRYDKEQNKINYFTAFQVKKSFLLGTHISKSLYFLIIDYNLEAANLRAASAAVDASGV